MPRNPVVYFEIGCTSGDASGKFFSELFDWHVGSAEDGFTIDTGGASDLPGHLVELAPEWGNYVTVYVQVENLNETLAAATALGGKTLVEPVRLEGRGTAAWIASPEGNIVGLWMPKTQGAAEEPSG